MKTAFYCQHSIGIGHLVRTLRIAEACLTNGPVLLICGGEIPPRLQIDPRILLVALPPLRADENHKLIDVNGGGDVDEVLERRRKIAVDRIREFLPEALVVEMYPFGRKKFATEVLSIITAARKHGSPKIFCSVRDVLVTTRLDQKSFDRSAAATLNENFDAVLVHSDPKLVGLDATFSMFDEINIPVLYTGYISNEVKSRTSQRRRQIIVSAGGGRVGYELIDAAIEAFPRVRRDLTLDMVIVTGPNGDGRPRPANGQPGLRIVKFINNLSNIIAESTISVSQCGYNTAVDVLKTRTPAIFVPYETESENEQLKRAELLAENGCAVVLRQESLMASDIANAAAEMLSSARESSFDINLNGAARSSRLIREVGCCA